MAGIQSRIARTGRTAKPDADAWLMPEPERSLTIALLLGTYPICRLDRWEELPAWALSGQFVSITRTPDGAGTVRFAATRVT